VLGPEINKIFQRASDLNDFAGILIFCREFNRSLVNFGHTALSNDRTAGISPAILLFPHLSESLFSTSLLFWCLVCGWVCEDQQKPIF